MKRQLRQIYLSQIEETMTVCPFCCDPIDEDMPICCGEYGHEVTMHFLKDEDPIDVEDCHVIDDRTLADKAVEMLAIYKRKTKRYFRTLKRNYLQ